MAEHICGGFSELSPEIFAELSEASGGFSELPLRDKYKRYAILLSGQEPSRAQSILRELRLDNDTIAKAVFLVKELFVPIKSDSYDIKLRMQPVTRELFSELIGLKELFAGTKQYKELCGPEDIKSVRSIFERIVRRDEPVYLKELIVKGSDLIKAGMEPGEEVGSLLRLMHDDVLRHPEHNSILFLFSRYLYNG